MKTPSGTLTLIIIAAIAIAAVLIFRAFFQGPGKLPHDKKFTLHIGHGHDVDDFADFKDGDGKDKFDAALRILPEAQYEIRIKPNPTATPQDHYTPPPTPPPNANLKTDKVTIAALAKNAPPGDPHVTQQVTSNSPAEIQRVLDALK